MSASRSKRPKRQKVKSRPQKPLSFAEKQSFAEMMSRQKGESIIEHWKRRKALLSYPDKPFLIAQHQDLQMRLNAEQGREQVITIEQKSIASYYQKQRMAQNSKQSKTQKRDRKRGRGR